MCSAYVQEEDWRARESAILALGAIAEGCVMGLIPYLPQLVSMLLPRLEDPRPLVRLVLQALPQKLWAIFNGKTAPCQLSAAGIIPSTMGQLQQLTGHSTIGELWLS